MTRKLNEILEPPLTEARLERQWSRISSGVGRGSTRARIGVLALGLGGVLAIGVAVILLGRGPAGVERSPTLLEGAQLESGAAESAIAFGDGSQIDLMPETRVAVETSRQNEVRLHLHRGRARFEIAHRAGRRFVVAAGEVEVAVIGTRFSVTRDHGKVEVAVERGIVEVSRKGRVLQRLLEGQRLEAEIESGTEPAPLLPATQVADSPPQPPPPPHEAEPSAPDLAEDSGEDPVAPTPPERHPRPAHAAKHKAREPEEHRADPKELFDRANLSRRSGDVRDAAALYAELTKRFPNDARAGLAAFELGRLRMDSLNDPSGAIRALEQALTRAPQASFIEDALARLVTAHDALGHTADCIRARAEYLRRYPDGVHKSALAGRCAPR
jgi:transmembrane sensor